jgi:hypothetical protein
MIIETNPSKTTIKTTIITTITIIIITIKEAEGFTITVAEEEVAREEETALLVALLTRISVCKRKTRYTQRGRHD